MTDHKRRKTDHSEKKRPKHLYVTPAAHKAVRLEAALWDAEMGEVAEAAIAAFFQLDEESRWCWIHEQKDEPE